MTLPIPPVALLTFFLSNFIFLFKALSIRESIYFFISKENESVWDVLTLSRPVFVLMLYESYERVGLFGVSSTKGTYELVISVFETP